VTKTRESTVTIVNELGLHARAATQFVQLAAHFEADVFVIKDGQEVNGKSILGMLTLMAVRDTRLRLRAEGTDADELIMALEELVASKFGENR
jgi:phosphocarrier protein